MKGLIYNQTEVDRQLQFPAGMNRVYLYCCHCYCRNTYKYIARILHWPHGLWNSNPHERVDSAASNRNQWLTECLSATLCCMRPKIPKGNYMRRLTSVMMPSSLSCFHDISRSRKMSIRLDSTWPSVVLVWFCSDTGTLESSQRLNAITINRPPGKTKDKS